LRRKFNEKILKEADIIICTLNFSGNSTLDCLVPENHENSQISALIIDEAAQCLEVDFLIPLRFRCDKIIQVGDPFQLPATVCSIRAQDFKFSKSFFERVYRIFSFENENPIRMLTNQYRMHPEICLFPSSHFYKGKLVSNTYFNNIQIIVIKIIFVKLYFF
jgi:senataxin